jgi:phosphatidylglycerol:prolipoprotein diacylglycerol transferase
VIDPVLFTIRLGNFQFSIYWYGVIVVVSILVGQWIASIEMRRRGENPDHLWDGLVWAIPAGMIGARLWYVLNDIAGGGTRYLENPLRVLNLHEGGLHFYGAVLFGALAFYLFARRRKLDMWLILDCVAPALLIGQGLARIANFINQELYGQPTSLPWGIPIKPEHRIPPYHQLDLYPESTRFHPSFGYEMIYNFLAAAFLMWITRRYAEKERPGAAFAGWLILAGVGRQIIEFFRPDQPRLPGTDISYSRIVAALMILGGALILLIKYEIIRLPFLSAGRKKYFYAPPLYPMTETPEGQEPPEEDAQVSESKGESANRGDQADVNEGSQADVGTEAQVDAGEDDQVEADTEAQVDTGVGDQANGDSPAGPTPDIDTAKGTERDTHVS